MSGKQQYSIQTHTSIFKVAVEYKELTGEFSLSSHSSKMTSVSFKVTKRELIMSVWGKIEILHKPS